MQCIIQTAKLLLDKTTQKKKEEERENDNKEEKNQTSTETTVPASAKTWAKWEESME